jgi:hypothetical protein
VRGPHPIALNEHYVGHGDIVYRQACKLGCEGSPLLQAVGKPPPMTPIPTSLELERVHDRARLIREYGAFRRASLSACRRSDPGLASTRPS